METTTQNRRALGATLALLLAAGSAGWAQDDAGGATRTIRLADAMAAAATGAAKAVAAEEAYADAVERRSDAASWKGLRLSVDGSWSGDLSPEPAGPGGEPDPWVMSGSLSLPLLTGLSVSASARLGGEVGGSVSWSPLAGTQSTLDLDLKVFQALTALEAARSQARLDAMEAFVQLLAAEAARDEAASALERARAALELNEASAARGELGAAALARARAAVPRAQAAWNRAAAQARQAREALAELAGPVLSADILAGAPLDANSALEAADREWIPPVAPVAGKQVLDAAAALETARAAGIFSGSGPVSLKGSVSSDGSIGLSGSVTLDWATVGGSAARSRAEAIADAQDALADAREAELDAWEALLTDEENARLAREECEAALVAADTELAQAIILHRLGELLPEDLEASRESAAKAALDLLLARLELARARLALEP